MKPSRRLTSGAATAVMTTVLAVIVAAGAVLAAAAFSDVTGHAHEAEINIARDKGLFAGYDDGTFRPDRKLTNRQSETVLGRLLNNYVDNDGNSTLTRAEAAVVLARGVCGLDGDCPDDQPPASVTASGNPSCDRGFFQLVKAELVEASLWETIGEDEATVEFTFYVTSEDTFNSLSHLAAQRSTWQSGGLVYPGVEVRGTAKYTTQAGLTSWVVTVTDRSNDNARCSMVASLNAG